MATLISVAPPPSHTPLSLHQPSRLSLLPPTTTTSFSRRSRHRAHPPSLRCEVAVRSDSSAASISESDEIDEDIKNNLAKVGSKVRVKSPMIVYHVPRVPEVELTPEMEGVVKQYVGFWKGKRITANYPFKVEFSIEVENRGKVKFVTHLREEEIDFIE